MRIFYKIWLSGDSTDAQLLSVGLAADNGTCLYAELTDISADVDEWAQKYILDDFYGSREFDKIVASTPKTAAISGSIEYVKKNVKDFLAPHKYIELVSHASYAETQAMQWMIDWDDEVRNIHVVNYSKEIMDKYGDLIEAVRTDLPSHNALREALFYKHIARKINVSYRKK